MSESLANDLTVLAVAELPKSVEREMRQGYELRQKMAVARQERINEDARRTQNRILPGGVIGERVCRVDTDVYFHFARQYGAECWNDDDFLKHSMKTGLIQKERGRPTNPTLLVNGFRK